MRHTFIALLTAGVMLAGTTGFSGEGWPTDWAQAKKTAAKENKLILVDFSGSDWCGWCVKLDKEVFSQPAFLKGAKEKFVLMLADYPRDKSGQSEELQAQNEKLRTEFQIKGYPSVYLTTAEGKPIAKTGYEPGGPEKYLAALEKMAQDYEDVQKLRKKLPTVQGIEKAKLLDQICKKMSIESPEKLGYVDEILRLDADGKAGLKASYMAQKLLPLVIGALRSGKGQEALQKCDEVLALEGLDTELKQTVVFFKSNAVHSMGDKPKAKDLLLEARKIDPKSDMAKNIDRILASDLFKEAPKDK
ncbi:MAG: thioredoxin family protein [Lentisphaeria bacterium]|nr:thioredoxin family protein [Lentisphaeria bacterium]